MKDSTLDYFFPPLPILWLLVLALLLWRWRRLSGALLVAATLLFALLAMPAVGRLLEAPLAAAAAPFDPEKAPQVAAILVPTAGAFADPDGTWWPTPGSVARGVVGRRLMRELGLPLLVSGGVTEPGQPPESETLAAALELADPRLRLETVARNSAETGAEVAALLADGAQPAVLLVTHPNHLARMSAALRHHGISVFAAPWTGARRPLRPLDFLPSDAGLKMTRGALWEYMGIAWYLLTGQIDLADLSD